jgi:hypothetical protein
MAARFRLDGRIGEAAGIESSVLPCGPTLAMLEFRAFLSPEEASLCGEIISGPRVLFVRSLRGQRFHAVPSEAKSDGNLRSVCLVKARVVPRRSMGSGCRPIRPSLQMIDHVGGCAAT